MATAESCLYKMSEETFDFVCTACDKENRTLEAVRYCVECLGYCCQECTDLHSRFPALQNHNLLDVGQGNQDGNQRPRLPEFPTERCCLHQGKVLDMFCEKHDIVGCSTCILNDHRSCQDSKIHSIPDMINSLINLLNGKKIHKKLKDLMVSMTTLIDSKDVLLARLEEAKNEAIEKVTKFQKALESAVEKVAEMSRKEVEDIHRKIEEEILHDKTDLQNAKDVLQVTKEKLNKAEGNRAQHFVCTKIAERKMKDTENEMTGRNMNDSTEIIFIPNHTLLGFINGLHSIGEVVSKSPGQKVDLYKVKGRKEINTRLTNDGTLDYSNGCCLTYDSHLLVTDCNSQKLKRIDLQTLAVVDYCKFDSQPFGVCCINEHEVVVACNENMVQFVSIDSKMKPTRQFKMSHRCFGIASRDDKLYITDTLCSVYIHDMSGNLLKIISRENAGKKLFSRHVAFNKSGNRMYVSDWYEGIVCFDGEGNYLSTIHDSDLDGVDGVCVDGRGNIFVIGYKSHNVVQFNEDGEKIGVVVKDQDVRVLWRPHTVCFHPKLNRLFVTMERSNAVKIFELE